MIKEICDETKTYNNEKIKKEYYHFFNTLGMFILKLSDFEKRLGDAYFSLKSFDELQNENKELFNDIIKKNYSKKSYANPTYCVNIFGDRFGKLFCYFYCIYRKYIQYALYHQIYIMEELNKLFINVYNNVKNNKLKYNYLQNLITEPQRKDKTKETILEIKKQFDKNFRYMQDIIEKSDLSDLRYLFRYGKYITENEIKTAKFLYKYSNKKIKKLSKQISNAYINGAIINQRDISKKSTFSIIFTIGQERIVRQLIIDMKKHNLEPTIMDAQSSNPNKQFNYDHRFDSALFLDKEYTELSLKSYGKAAKKCKKVFTEFSGIILLDKFGEPTFTPISKNEYIMFTKKQQKMFQKYQNNFVWLQDKFLPRKEISFTIISFPSPEIGKNYENIFEDILEVNMLDTKDIEHIQQKMIDALDLADYVHVKGKGKNKTDIRVQMQTIMNPEKETNFVNCGADINIPVGEVFTTPQLKGTNGILHFKQTYLKGLKFNNLILSFKDGYIVSYSCNNFKSMKDNKKYIEENLLFPHKTLPIGEFAIGTNTLAYVIAKKHKIMNILPVLIIEKMGPHFAIGDTCFSMSEDKPVFNRLDNKEIVARENEKTALRKTNVDKAYTHHHTDITLPYESIKYITAVTENGKRTDIIRNGKFVLKGTKKLNKNFMK
ncbi:aminopeptidase [candidate division WOR-3 bacterium]|nr:aminopeptidase [candidate division WOR-3 bacterium]